MPVRHLIVFLAAGFSWAAAFADQTAVEAQLDQGRRLYTENCVACHGVEARGDGVVAAALKGAVPDLTRLAQDNGGRFPRDRVYRVIDGRLDVAAHGTRLMPVWGSEFWLGDGADERAEITAAEKLHALVAYLKSLQEN